MATIPDNEEVNDQLNNKELFLSINDKLDIIITLMKQNKTPMMTIDNAYIPNPFYKS